MKPRAGGARKESVLRLRVIPEPRNFVATPVFYGSITTFPMKNPWIIPAAALALGGIGGFITGKGTSPAGTQATTTEGAEKSRSSSRAGAAGSEEETKRGPRAQSVADAMNTPGHSARVKALIDYYASLTPEQLAEESKKLEALPMSERIMASFLLFGRWAEVDPMAAMAASNAMGFAGGFVRPTIMQSWASVDPENAAKYYSENPREFAMMGGFGGGPGGGGASGASLIASEWAKQDPQGAMAWASSLTGDDKTRAMTSVIRELAMTDPKKAAEMAGSIDASERGDAYASIAQRWGASNFADAESWIRTLPADQQAAAMASAINGLSQENPELALTKIASMPDGDEKNRAMRDTLGNLSRTNPEAALTELAKQDAELQRRTIDNIIPNLAAKNNAAAVQYINTLQAGDVRDSAVSSYVMSDRKSEPSSLMAMAETITDERDRERTMGVAAMKWMREDSTAARSYIESSTIISDNAKQRMLNGGGRGPGGWRGR